MAEKDEESASIEDTVVVTKYKIAAEIANKTLKKLIESVKEGESVLNLCIIGDKLILEETEKVYKKEKDLKKGIAFPTCISANNCVCHFSPLPSEPDCILKNGDVVKIDLGAHVDGLIAVVAHTLVVGATKDNPVTGRKADVILAAYNAAEAALRLVKPGNENNQVTSTIDKIAEEFKCKPVEGMLSHQLEQDVIDGEKSIIQNPTETQRKDHKRCQFEVNEVYAIDMLMSSGEGKSRETGVRTTVYKKTEVVYNLKMKASRAFFSEVERKFGVMPFTLRALNEEAKAKMGVVECTNHEVVQPFNVLWEKEGEFVAQFKFTVLLMPNGPLKITGLPFEAEMYKSEHSVQDESLKTLLATSISRKTAKKKKKKAAKEVAASQDSPQK